MVFKQSITTRRTERKRRTVFKMKKKKNRVFVFVCVSERTLFMSKSGCESKSGHPPNPGTWHDTIAADVHTKSKTNFSLNNMTVCVCV